MQLRMLGKTGLQVSAFGMGSMTFGGQTKAWDARQMLDQFIHEGGNFIDTASGYNKGAAEQIIGQWMRDGDHRPYIILSTKAFHPEGGDANHRGLSRHAILHSVEQSLRRLGTDYIDLYTPAYWDTYTPLEETLRALEQLIQQGKVRYIACSNYAGWQIAEALATQTALGWSRFVAAQAPYSLLMRDIERETLGAIRHYGLGLLAWSPLGGGFLSGKFAAGEALDEKTRLGQAEGARPYFHRSEALNERGWAILETVQMIAAAYEATPAQVALAWLHQQPHVTSTIIGASQIAHVDLNLLAAKLTLSADDLAQLDEASALLPSYPRYLDPLRAEDRG